MQYLDQAQSFEFTHVTVNEKGIAYVPSVVNVRVFLVWLSRIKSAWSPLPFAQIVHWPDAVRRIRASVLVPPGVPQGPTVVRESKQTL